MLVLSSVTSHNSATPPMGWSASNLSCKETNHYNIINIADQIIFNKHVVHGYNHIVLNECWMLDQRNVNGNLMVDSMLFPKGIDALRSDLKNKGIPLGLTLSAGVKTCNHGKPGSLDHEEQDAA